MSSTAEIAIVQLGRWGDLINIMPAVHEIAARKKVHLVISQEFDGLFEDGPNLKIHPLPLYYAHVLAAVQWSKKTLGLTPIVTQAWSDAGCLNKHSSFALDSYAQLEGESVTDWEKARPNPPRSLEREKWLLDQIEVDPSQGVMVNLSGNTSPMPNAHAFYSKLVQHFPAIVNLGALRAQRLQDFLGLYDRYKVLITIDTATLHLAKNHPKLVLVQLRTDNPNQWISCPPLPNSKKVLGYEEALSTADVWMPSLRKEVF